MDVEKKLLLLVEKGKMQLPRSTEWVQRDNTALSLTSVLDGDEW